MFMGSLRFILLAGKGIRYVLPLCSTTMLLFMKEVTKGLRRFILQQEVAKDIQRRLSYGAVQTKSRSQITDLHLFIARCSQRV